MIKNEMISFSGILLLFLTILTGCSPFHPAASIRVEVDVYKGPLSKPISIQIAELNGIALDTRRTLLDFNNLQKKVLVESCYDESALNHQQNSAIVHQLMQGENASSNEVVERGLKQELTAKMEILNQHYLNQASALEKQINSLSDKNEKKQALMKLKKLENLSKINPNHLEERQTPQLDTTVSSFYLAPRDLNCSVMYSLYTTVNDLITNLENIEIPDIKRPFDNQNEIFENELIKLSKIAAQMKTQSAQAAAQLIAFVSSSERVRIAQNSFSNITSEYGNLILSRTNDLMIQVLGYGDADSTSKGVSRKKLHLNSFLSDSSTTQSPWLHEWYNAKIPVAAEEWRFFLPGYNVSMGDRIRIYEQMFDDAYWSNVNTVYASGIGNVSMALIRDDIGNWNLKSFDNDPKELLDAYKNVSLEVLNRAAKIAAKGASGGGTEAAQAAAQAAIGIANQLSTSMTETTTPNLPIDRIKGRIVNQLEQIRTEYDTSWEKNMCNSETNNTLGTNTKEDENKLLTIQDVDKQLVLTNDKLRESKETLKQKEGTLQEKQNSLKNLESNSQATPQGGNTESKESLRSEITALSGEITKLYTSNAILEGEIKTLNEKKNKNQTCKDILQATNTRIKDILYDYGTMLDTMQEINIPDKKN